MYKLIVVALDGSERAEAVLPHVEALAKALGSSVTLLQATTSLEVAAANATLAAPGAIADVPVMDMTGVVEDERHQAARYLEEVAERLRKQGLKVGHEHPEGPAAATIVSRARELGADLIAMTTRGRGGFDRLVFGSVADEVLRTASCPIFLVGIGEENRQA